MVPQKIHREQIVAQKSVSSPVEPVGVIRKGENDSTKGEKTGFGTQWQMLTAVCAGTEVGLGWRLTMGYSLLSLLPQVWYYSTLSAWLVNSELVLKKPSQTFALNVFIYDGKINNS